MTKAKPQSTQKDRFIYTHFDDRYDLVQMCYNFIYFYQQKPLETANNNNNKKFTIFIL